MYNNGPILHVVRIEDMRLKARRRGLYGQFACAYGEAACSIKTNALGLEEDIFLFLPRTFARQGDT
jgi:hypothetical protein